jgi:hypothetical protein
LQNRVEIATFSRDGRLFQSILIKISGIPLLEKAADEKWGGNADYEAYKRRTSTLLLLPPK